MRNERTETATDERRATTGDDNRQTAGDRARIARRTAYELHEERAARVYRRHRQVVDCECDCHAYDLTRNGVPVYIDSPDCRCYVDGERQDLRPFER